MAKIGTAHVEIKPVINEEALDAIAQRIEDAIAAGVERALNRNRPPVYGNITVSPGMTFTAQDTNIGCPCRVENGGSGVCGCTLGGPKVTC